jgi:putative membrane protein
MLVFRNQTSYNRFWEGRSHLQVMITSVRNLTRMFLSGSSCAEGPPPPRDVLYAQRLDTQRTVHLLIAILYATKNHLRAGWGMFSTLDSTATPTTNKEINHPEYFDLLPPGMLANDHKGLGIPLQFTLAVEQYIKRGYHLNWWHGPQASQMTVQLNALVDAYGKMETIRLTPVPVAHLIHQKQVLALFGMILPFAMVDEMGWWAVPITMLVAFTLYGIDGIAGELEDPFGRDRIDINMDAIVEDIREETLVVLDEWKRVGGEEGVEWFTVPQGERREPELPVFRLTTFTD